MTKNKKQSKILLLMTNNDCVAANYKPRKWYNSYKFPLIPIYEYKKGNEYNTSGFSFHWLFIRVWNLDAFNFEISVNLDTHWGIGVAAILPYLRIVLAIPFPERFNIWCQRNLWRKPPKPNN